MQEASIARTSKAKKPLNVLFSSFSNPLKGLSGDKDVSKDILKAWAKELLSCLHGSPAGENMTWETDAQFLSIRTILLQALEDKTSDNELKQLCLTLMARIGAYTGNAEAMVTAA
jgi:hypothetical protein